MDTTKEMTGIPNIYTALCSTSWTGGPSKCVTIRDCILEGIEDYHTNPSRPQLKVTNESDKLEVIIMEWNYELNKLVKHRTIALDKSNQFKLSGIPYLFALNAEGLLVWRKCC